MGIELLIGTPVMPQKILPPPPKKIILAMFKCMVSIATHNAFS